MKRMSCVMGMVMLCLLLAGCTPKKAVPDVVGQTREAASAAIANANLTVGATTEEYSATVAAGTVISQSPTADTLVRPGSVVALTVSKGPQPLTVPNVVGQPQSAASTAITGAGFAVGAVTQGYSATVAVGAVVSQTPAPGTEAAPGTAVNLVVSLGGAPVAVPNAVGQTQTAAQTTINDAGLTVGTVTEEYHATIPTGQVISQNPTAGASVSQGSAVALTVSKGPQPSVAVPNVVGQTQTAASTAITGANLTVGTIMHEFSATVTSGSVISQTPAAGTSVSTGSVVALTVSKGPQPAPVAVPDVRGQTQAAASTAITVANLTVGTITQAFSATVVSGVVIGQTPATGTLVSPGSAVALTVSKGPAVAVPNVVGLTQAAATTAITGVNLTVGTVKQMFSSTVASGAVISQSPTAGTPVNPHSAVALTVSKGPQPVAVPNVVGQTQAAASTALTGANLTLGTITQEFSATVAADVVISQSPASGTPINPGSAVALTVSKGPQPPVTVPNVVGQTQAAASTTLTDAGLTVGTITQAFSEIALSGSVISQSPASGTSVSPATAVALTVSKGPQPVTVPNVVGQTEAAASTTITGAGLTLGAVTQVFSETVPSGTVVSQTPTAGTSVSPGSAVALNVSKGPQPVTVLNVVGQTQAAAFTAINGANLTVGAITQEFSATVASGLVISQSPAAGTSVNPGYAMALTVSKGAEVPNVLGQTQAAASAAITDAGLTVGAITPECSDTVTAGCVIIQSPAADSQGVVSGSSVALVIATGPCNVIEEAVLLPGGVPLVMVWIPGGTFTMGTSAEELGSFECERPPHVVAVSGFWMGKYELTKRQWTAVMGTTPWNGQDNVFTDTDSPAVYVSWDNTQSFLAELNSHTSKSFRLPSEAEWEYACRSGTTARFYWGDDSDSMAIDDYAWYGGNAWSIGQQYGHVVGLKLPNFLDLYDMSGNIWEWCEDFWHSDYTEAPTDGSVWGTPADSYRVVRGGAWLYNANDCRSACRNCVAPDNQSPVVGFRVTRTPEPVAVRMWWA